MNVLNKLLTAFFMLFLAGFLVSNCKEKKEDITPQLLAVYNQHPYHSAYTTKTAANNYDEFSASLLVSSGCSTALRNANINIENAWITLTTPPANLKINPVFSGIACVYGSASAVSTIAGKCATLADAF